MSELIEKLNWRYATKRMNGESVPQEKLDNILEAIKLAPSSVGLQPYNIVIVKDQALKDRIHNEAASRQAQIPDASHLLIFAVWEKVTSQHVDDYIKFFAATRNISVESLAGFHSSINGGILSRSEDVNFDWSARQAYIALGHGLVAAATEEVDATPMEGFDAAKVDEILGLREKGLRSVVILALGYRDADKDPYVNAKKVRRSREELFISI
ncbi:NAD(P)H-dependent oxidoreductase [Dyadobacter fermentans]|uniref:Nitroreductase n=1 Tax=Dyadobacter fermentans (strain ATCC 700827 / DSM 18053 / CIP 107007 / KCTC 52180 / NS114) TaxID=471854 RepID=C6W2Q5_DYAFD|nr:NAD(P)H-dependent oxidoreductase [Dyadobacter fermentans]ACT93909.1 nitroreductase [Dyadobacter fermentans DSM 18053]